MMTGPRAARLLRQAALFNHDRCLLYEKNDHPHDREFEECLNPDCVLARAEGPRETEPLTPDGAIAAAIAKLRALGRDLNRGAIVPKLAKSIWDACDVIAKTEAAYAKGATFAESVITSQLEERAALDARLQALEDEMRDFARSKSQGGQHTREKSAREMVEAFADRLATARRGE